MFDSTYMNKNNKLIKECERLIEEHNKLSYQEVSLNIPLISFDDIKPKYYKYKNVICKEIVQFYEKYAFQMIIVLKLKKIIESIQYTNEDLTLHIDRSSDSIIQLFSSLASIRFQLIESEDEMFKNISNDVEAFVKYFKSLLSPHIHLDEVIEIIFICMKQKGLREKLGLDTSDRPFIHVGIKLIEILYRSNMLSYKNIELIKAFNDDLKHAVLEVNNTIQSMVSINRLQTFGLTPDEGNNCDIQTVINKLFGLQMKHVGTIKELLEPLSKILKLSEADTGISTGLLIIISPNDDTYFDMSNLDTVSMSNGSAGINENMVKTFDLIQQGPKSSETKSELLAIGIDPHKTQIAYILWTNDLKHFKMRSKAIYGHLIKKIIRNSPSLTIEAYNQVLEDTIVNNRTEDVISFNRVKYMSFNDSVTEDDFLKKFQTKLVSAIVDATSKLEGIKLQKAIVEPKFTKEVLTAMDAAKTDLGIHPQLLSSHCHIIYASMANTIVYKLKKELILHQKINKTIATEIVKGIVETNDNIYSRVIASYYLQIS